MRKYLLLSLLLSTFSFNSNAQVFYTETFDGTTCAAGSGCDPSLIGWSVTIIGAQGATPNTWYVSDQESGMPAGQCGAAGAGDQSLHVGNVAGSTCSFFCPAGDCGAAYDACGPTEVTNKRAQSPVINCTGQSNITVSFNYIEGGQGTQDDCVFEYSDNGGTTWTQVNALAKTAVVGACGGQGFWTNISFTLPAAANNNPNVRIGFRWQNDGDGNGSDPSFAVDDITLSATATTGPTASFTISQNNFCAGQCINFTNTSTGSPFTSTSWNFGGGASPNTSTTDSPTSICFNTAGTYTVTLTVTNASGSDTETATVTVLTEPTASFTASSTSICQNACINYTGTSSGGPFTSTNWTFAGSSTATSTSASPSNICYPTAGTFAAQLIVVNSSGCNDTISQNITVAPGPTASFTSTGTNLCVNDCINYTNTSTGGPFTGTGWQFNGSSTATSTSSNPTNICYPTVGTFTTTLIVGVGTCADTATSTITVTTCTTPPVSSFTSNAGTTVCEGDIITFTDNSTNGPTGWAWTVSPAATFAGGTTASSQNPQIQFATAGTYTITLTASNSIGTGNTASSTITVVVCSTPPVSAFTSNAGATVCAGDILTFTDASTGTPTSWAWTVSPAATFSGGTTASSQNPQIQFNTAGTYTVTLTASNASGAGNTATQTITVINCTTPTAVFTVSDNTICAGSCVTFTNSSTGATIYGWNFPGGTPSTSTSQNPGTVCFSGAGTFTVTLIVSNGTTADTATTTITVSAAPTVTASQDTLIDLGNTVTISATGSGSGTYSWTPTTGLSCTTCASPNASPQVTTDYVVTYTLNGCSATDTVVVSVNIIEGIGVPNAFTPNDDGNNDVLFVMGQGITEMHFVVYNRYGQKVFETTDQTVGWDGTLDGKKFNTGVFVWHLDYTMISGESGTLKGDVTLFR
jgi:gliding motility-associated-like protein